MTGPASSFSFPTITHVCGATWHDQIVTVSKEHVAAGKHEPAIFRSREINFATYSLEPVPVRSDLAVDAQTRHSPIWEDLEAKMRKPVVVEDCKMILRIAL